MWQHTALEWQEPLLLAYAAEARGDTHFVLLYSGQRYPHTGRYSYLALALKQEVSGSDFEVLPPLTNTLPWFENAWFGYLGYELKHALETLPPDMPGSMDLPNLWFGNFRLILRFDHETRSMEAFAESPEALSLIPSPLPLPPAAPARVSALASNMSKEEYFRKVESIRESILRGDIYQANLTRKFFGETSAAPFLLFAELCRVSPAAYSAYLRIGNTQILSSSPERFLTLDTSGVVETRPIKGSARRSPDPKEDSAARAALEKSEKDRAENLMIVDLMRNDLSRGCVPGSVSVEGLFEVTSYPTVHHMASTVHGMKRPDLCALDLIKSCFPPGSMTGAPKIRAMEICSSHERIKRGVYSGALGWFGGDGSTDFSVVIRTLILHHGRFEFQVGGAIVYDSKPEEEWQETLTKATGIAKALGITLSSLEAL